MKLGVFFFKKKKKRKRENEKSHREWHCSRLGRGPRFRLCCTGVDRTSLSWSLWIAWLTVSAWTGLSCIWHASAGNPLKISMKGPLGCVCGTDHFFIFCSAIEPRMLLLWDQAPFFSLLPHSMIFSWLPTLCRLPKSGSVSEMEFKSWLPSFSNTAASWVPKNVKLNPYPIYRLYSHSVHISCLTIDSGPQWVLCRPLCDILEINRGFCCCCCYHDKGTTGFDCIPILVPGMQKEAPRLTRKFQAVKQQQCFSSHLASQCSRGYLCQLNICSYYLIYI